MSDTTGTKRPERQDAGWGHALPDEQPLAMPEQDFTMCFRTPDGRAGTRWAPRAAIVIASLLLTAAFAYELFDVLAGQHLTPIQIAFLVLSTLAFAWIAAGSLSAAMGFLQLFAGEPANTVTLPSPDRLVTRRTALLFPVYREDPALISGTISAMAKDLASLGQSKLFDVFILSDTRSEAEGRIEKETYARLALSLRGTVSVHYRRRRDNAGRKAGNIRDWVERWGGAHAYFVILDGDSLMSGQTLVRLVLAMDDNPRAGLIQTVPRLTGGTTLLQRLTQFASNVYGPTVAAGLAFWHRDEGNYWGHNAIIRTTAFAGAAGLPQLPGRAPFGGHIQSHDFVEAVLLQRAGWGVHMVPTLDGSYEGLPPTLVDVVVRDRRWAQGNLQHLSIVTAAGLTPMGRVHLVMGALSYLVSAVWAASLAVGMVLALQVQHIIPSYFTDGKTLFPIWPIVDPGAALRLFLATLAVVLLPKALGLLLELKRVRLARETGGTLRAIAGVTTETVFSMLLAPVLMVTQTVAIFQILLGMDSGWKAQERRGQCLSLAEAGFFHWRHTLVGAVLLVLCYSVSPVLIAWMAPLIVGLLLSILLSWFTARPAGAFLSYLLSTREDRIPPAICNRAREEASAWRESMDRIGAAAS